MKKRIINTSLRDYEKDLGISELEKQIEILKKQAALGCLYSFIDVKREFVPNGVLYMGQSQEIKSRMIFYRKQKSELLEKLQKRLNLWDYHWGMEHPDGGVMGPDDKTEEEINKLREFIRDPERCRLIIRAKEEFNDPEVRKKWEKLYINRYKPLLNKIPWHPFRASRRRFYMNQLHPDPEQRNPLPVYCLHTGDVLAAPTEEYITQFNRRVSPTEELIT
jgi:hypothetical protein|tara:strand:+ start:49 stop:708 length:660 start_codon:yes stop_codon:yes gene_type:complete